MTDFPILDPSQHVVGGILAAATKHASAAMNQWTNGQATLSLDQVFETPLEEATAELDLGMDLLTMVVLGVDGEYGGQLILAFDDENGRKLAATLLNREVPDDPEWSAIEQSAIMETGNIMGSAYLSEMTRLLGTELKPSAPYFIQDFGASVLEQALMAQAAECDTVLVCQTHFEFNNQQVNWHVFFVPDHSLVTAMNEAIHTA